MSKDSSKNWRSLRGDCIPQFVRLEGTGKAEHLFHFKRKIHFREIQILVQQYQRSIELFNDRFKTLGRPGSEVVREASVRLLGLPMALRSDSIL